MEVCTCQGRLCTRGGRMFLLPESLLQRPKKLLQTMELRGGSLQWMSLLPTMRKLRLLNGWQGLPLEGVLSQVSWQELRCLSWEDVLWRIRKGKGMWRKMRRRLLVRVGGGGSESRILRILRWRKRFLGISNVLRVRKEWIGGWRIR